MQQHESISGSSAINWDFDIGRTAWITEVRIHLSDVGGNDDLVITLNSALGSEHDIVRRRIDMTSIYDIVWTPESEDFFIAKEDKMNISWSNPNSRSYGIEVLYR